MSTAIPPKVLQAGLESGRYLLTDNGLEKRCGRCREYWPADAEFFHRNAALPDGLAGDCKACCAEIMSALRTASSTTSEGRPA